MAEETNVDSSGKFELSISWILGTVWKRKILIGIVTAVFVLASVLFSVGSILLKPDKSYLPNVYTPTAVLLFSTSNSNGLSSMLQSSDMAGIASLAGLSSGGNSNLKLAMLLARTNTTLDELNNIYHFDQKMNLPPNSKSKTRGAILGKLKLSIDEKTSTLNIGFEDINPKFARDVVNSFVEILDRRFSTLGGNKIQTQKAMLEAKLAEVDNSIKELERKVKDFQRIYGVYNMESLVQEQVTILAQLRSELILKDMEIQNYANFSSVDDPVTRRLKSERDNLQKQIDSLERGSGDGKSVIKSQKDLPDIAFKYAELERDLNVQTAIFKLLTQQYEITKLNAEGQDPTFQIIELAEIPDQKSGPSRGKLCAIISLLGFCAIVFYVLLQEAYRHYVPQGIKGLILRGK